MVVSSGSWKPASQRLITATCGGYIVILAGTVNLQLEFSWPRTCPGYASQMLPCPLFDDGLEPSKIYALNISLGPALKLESAAPDKTLKTPTLVIRCTGYPTVLVTKVTFDKIEIILLKVSQEEFVVVPVHQKRVICPRREHVEFVIVGPHQRRFLTRQLAPGLRDPDRILVTRKGRSC